MSAYRALGWFSALFASFLLLVGAEMMAQAESAWPAPTPLRTHAAAAAAFQPHRTALPTVVLPTIEVRPDPEDEPSAP